MSDPKERLRQRTPQEDFWAGDFGSAYITRNAGDQLLAANLHFFSRALQAAGPISSCLELGANIGMNLRALRLLYPALAMKAVEINDEAARVLAEDIGSDQVWRGSILDYPADEAFDLVLVKGVLIHVNPDALPQVYDTMHRASRRLILVAEYYNPTPMAVPYRGHADRLFKRDFAGDLLDRHPDLRLIDYGFGYRRDPVMPMDDATWFLLGKSVDKDL
jgi:pseudaminic acid biosynthesis-associated methylase